MTMLSQAYCSDNTMHTFCIIQQQLQLECYMNTLLWSDYLNKCDYKLQL